MSGIDVNSNKTPITQQPIEEVNGGQVWLESSISDLYDQLRILQNRYYIALDLGKTEMALQIERGIMQIQAIIQVKQEDAYNKGQYEIR